MPRGDGEAATSWWCSGWVLGSIIDFPETDFERVKLSDAATTAEVALPQKKKLGHLDHSIMDVDIACALYSSNARITIPWCEMFPNPPSSPQHWRSKEILELLPMAHLKWFSDSVIPKSFAQLHLAFAMNCSDVSFLILFDVPQPCRQSFNFFCHAAPMKYWQMPFT